jgi:cytochrome c oxidase assembly protein subunit 15
LQALSGVATVFLNFPLAIAVLHNAGAALLVLLVTMLNYKAKYLLAVAQTPSRQEHTPASLQP